MSEHTLFDITDDPEPPAATGREPAPWVTRHGINTGGYSSGCRCTPCVTVWRDYNQLLRQGLRRCQICANTYAKKVGGGSKFCNDCLAGGKAYTRNYPPTNLTTFTCARCEDTYKGKSSARYRLCPSCTQHPVFKAMSSRLGVHGAPIDLVISVMENPYCANKECGASLMEEVTTSSKTSHTKLRYNYCVDHDHTCCPREVSCGRCIRGVLCRRCNQMLISDQPAILHGLADYLDRHATR